MQTILFLWVIASTGQNITVQHSETTFFDAEACKRTLRLHNNTMDAAANGGVNIRSIGYCASRGTTNQH